MIEKTAVRVRGTKDLEPLGQVLVTIFLYFNLKNQLIFTKTRLTNYGIYSKFFFEKLLPWFKSNNTLKNYFEKMDKIIWFDN